MAIRDYDCLNCGAHLQFSPELQKLYCEYCESSYTIEELEKNLPETGSGQVSDPPKDTMSGTVSFEGAAADAQKAKTQAQVTQAQAHETAAQAGATASQSADPDLPVDKWDESAAMFVCDNCGAGIVTDQNTAATFCAFCGAPSIIAARLDDALRPANIIPFKLTRDQAIDSFFSWCKGGRITPRDFVSQKNVEKITGRYIPFWLFDYTGEVSGSATGKRISVATTGSKTITTTAHYNIRRVRESIWEGLPHDGLEKIDDSLIEYIEPFQYDQAVPFSMQYLSGFFADKYDIHAQDLFSEIDRKTNRYLEDVFRESISGYDRVENVSCNSRFVKRSARYTMLPVWFLNYKYKNQTYTFIVNGQTGKIAGVLPKSSLKILICLLATLIVASLLCRLIGIALLGGSVL